jgi:hypothetical protein
MPIIKPENSGFISKIERILLLITLGSGACLAQQAGGKTYGIIGLMFGPYGAILSPI